MMTKMAALQLLVAGSFLLVGVPNGFSVCYPGVLLKQLSSNDSSIQLDWDTASWIGSIHGVAAIPSILMPFFMQWRGRKITFIIACIISIVGWIIAFNATSASYILISESLQGFGSQSIWAVGLLSMSEMLSPHIRNSVMGSYVVIQAVGMTLVGIIGNYLHWRTITLIVCALLIIVLILAACIWPESPSWLAYRGEFDKCTKAFTRLRGTGELAQKELRELLLSQKECLRRDNKCSMTYFCQTVKRRDFYLPAIHIFMVLESMYWTGGLAILIYSSDVMPKLTHNMKDSALFGSISVNLTMFIGCITSVVLIQYFKSKIILLVCGMCGAVILVIVAAVNFCQNFGFLRPESYIGLYLITGHVFPSSVVTPIVTTLAAEIMPVKHRGIGGPLLVISSCALHTSLLKMFPYISYYMNLWGTFLLLAINVFLVNVYIWKCVPETKGKTLQQLEEFYNGNIDKENIDTQRASHELVPIIINK